MSQLDDEILKDYLIGNCSEEEMDQIDNWIKESDENANRLFKWEELYHLGKYEQFKDKKRIAKAEKRLFKQIDTIETKHHKLLKMGRWIKYAAMFIVILLAGTSIGYLIYQSNITRDTIIASANGTSVKQVVLPDGTKVWLNHSATIEYPRKFSKKERDVNLNGEAYFEVTKNPHQPFIVRSDAMSVKVLGTVFNFKGGKNSNMAEVTLLEGLIQVSGNQDQGMIVIKPGQKVILDKLSQQMTVQQVNAKLDAVWHNNLIPLNKVDIRAIAKILERFYNVQITVSSNINLNMTYSGVIKRKDTIDSVLTALCYAIPIEYKIVGNHIYLSNSNK